MWLPERLPWLWLTRGPSSEELASQNTANTRIAFNVLDGLAPIRAADDEKLTAKHSGTDVTFASSDKVSPLTAAETNMAPPIEGWSSATLTGKRDGGNATVMAYGNIEAPEYELFAVRYDGLTVSLVDDTDTGDVNEETVAWKKARILPGNKYSAVGNDDGGSIMGTYEGVEGTFTCTGTACPNAAR